jgi:DNA-binding response OmpR family regulator
MPNRSCILIVDDDANIRDIIRTRLRMAAYQTSIACNGVEALARIKDRCLAGMILDINMPGLDGFAVLAALRDQDLRIPTLVLTARHAAEDVRRAVDLGAKDFLAKPFNENQLMARVDRLMRVVRQPTNALIL